MTGGHGDDVRAALADVLMSALIDRDPDGRLWIHTTDLHPLRKYLADAILASGLVVPAEHLHKTVGIADALAARLADAQAREARAWGEAIQAVAWCLDNGEPSAAAALAYAAEHNPYRDGGDDDAR